MNAEMPPRFVKLTAELLAWALAEEPQAEDMLQAWGVNSVTLQLALHPPNVGEALIGRGRVLVAGGLIRYWPGRAEAWMLRSPFATPRDLVQATRHMCGVMDALQLQPEWRRIEVNVLAAAPWREAFAKALGCTSEGLMPAWDPSGRDFVRYGRVACPGWQ